MENVEMKYGVVLYIPFMGYVVQLLDVDYLEIFMIDIFKTKVNIGSEVAGFINGDFFEIEEQKRVNIV